MSRPAPLLAALALTIGATGFGATTLATAGSAAAATPTAVRVKAPCAGGPGTVVLTARPTASGSTAHTRLTGVTRKKWSGDTTIGRTSSAPTDSGKVITAVDGVLTDSASTDQSWPRTAVAEYMSAKGSVFCIAAVRANARTIVGATMNAATLVKPAKRVVRMGFEAAPGSRWRVALTVATPNSGTHILRRVTAVDGGIDTRFTRIHHLGAFTRVVAEATNLKNGKVRRVTLTRPA